MTKCSVCALQFNAQDYHALADHFYTLAEESDPSHVMWLNRYITKKKTKVEDLAQQMKEFHSLSSTTLKQWIKKRFIERFYGQTPHPFILALQHPSRATLLGYVLEHQHFLRQWARSCSYIMAKTEQDDVVLYELDNILKVYDLTLQFDH